MEASNVALVLPAPSLLTPSSTPSPSGEGMGTESMLLLFDDIWMKLMELAKKLRDIMRSYNVEKQTTVLGTASQCFADANENN